jgi:hypothetical protein
VRQWDPFLTKFGDRLPARLRALGARAVGHAAAYRRWQTSQPRTLVHDDFRLDNLFFGRPGAARPLVIFDWQLCLVGRGIADVAYFSACSLPIAQRRASERSLVDGYHAGLLAHGVRGYDRDRCWQDYRRAMFSALYRLIVAGGRLDYSSERGAALFRVLIDRIDASLADHGVGDLLPGWGEHAALAGPSREGGHEPNVQPQDQSVADSDVDRVTPAR